jgi:uncharacterized membrane protein YfcA
MTWQFVLAGLLVGTLVGMTGMGGGSLMTPMLILIFGFDPKTAVGTDILHGAVFKSFGAWRHRQLGNVHTKLALWMLAGSGPLSLLGVQLASSFSDSAQSTMSKVVGASLILGGLGFLAKTFLPIGGRRDNDDFAITTRVRIVAILIGAVFGFVVGLTSVGSGPLSLLGVQLASLFSDSAESTMSKVVGASLILGGLGFAAKTFLPIPQRPDDDELAITTRVRVIAITIGAVFGFIVGLTSVGSGTFFGLALLILFPLSATRMVGTDLLHAALLLFIAGAGHLLHGNVDLHAMSWLLVGSIPGVLLGSHLSIRVPERALRSVFALVLVLSGIKLVKTPAADSIILVGVVAGALVLVAWAVLTLKARRVPAGDPA